MDMIGTGDFLWAATRIADPVVLMYLLIGVFVGMIFGAAPGLTAPAGVAILTPVTFSMGFESSMALLLGTYCAGYFAGSIPAILINTPGTPGNAATALDGYQMAKQGRANRAVSLAVSASFIGGVFSAILLATIAPLLAKVAFEFTSVEYFSLALLGIVCVAGVSGESLLKGVAAGMFGILLSTVGLDPVGGTPRLTFDVPDLQGGIPVIPALIGLFAITELLAKAAETGREQTVLTVQEPFRLRALIPLYWREKWLTVKSAVIGTFIGILPATGPAIAAWISYGEAVRAAKPGDRFGKGDDKGVIAPEVANNAVTGGALVPLLTVGIPGDPVTAVLIGALLIQGVDAGPFFIRDHGNLFVFILLALVLSNLLMLVFGLAARRLLHHVVRVPDAVLIPTVAALCAAGGYAINSSSFDVNLIILLGVLGFVMIKFGFPMAPVVLGIVLGPILEENLRNALTASRMDPSIFVTRPISAVILAIAAILMIVWTARTRRS